MSKLFFYTSCTLTKSMVAPAHLCAGSLPHGLVSKRQKEWSSRIDGWEGDRPPARELYSGGRWSVVRGLARARPEIQCFVISAGYGLVPIDALLAPYEATFAWGQHNSVALAGGKRAAEENVEWWKRLCDWEPFGVKGPRSICACAIGAATDVHVFALSPFYLAAISKDLAQARQQLADSGRMIIVSSGKAAQNDLNANVIPVQADLQTLLGGGLVSLNVRIAVEAVNSIAVSNLTLEEVRNFVGDLTSRAKPRIYPKRCPVSDDQVIGFIKNAASQERKPSYTNLLRRFRDSGQACEMKRFKMLFQEAVTE
jgi:hypothetical protein